MWSGISTEPLILSHRVRIRSLAGLQETPWYTTGPKKYIIFQRAGPGAWSHDLSGSGNINLKYIFMENTIHLRWYVPPSPIKSKKKICTLCYGTGIIQHPKGIKVPCPNGCPGFYPSHRWRGSCKVPKKEHHISWPFRSVFRSDGQDRETEGEIDRGISPPPPGHLPTIVIFDNFLQPILTCG